jgi:hypothetical protein
MITITDLDAGPEIPHPAPMGVTELIIANKLLTEEEFQEALEMGDRIRRGEKHTRHKAGPLSDPPPDNIRQPQ